MKWVYFAKNLLAAMVFGALVITSSMAFSADNHKDASVKGVASIEAPINLNTADAATLTLLNGVGDKKAADIVAYRQARGKFSRVEDLLNVKGIGEKTLEKNRDRLIVN